jgi:hypothetical protein
MRQETKDGRQEAEMKDKGHRTETRNREVRQGTEDGRQEAEMKDKGHRTDDKEQRGETLGTKMLERGGEKDTKKRVTWEL